MYVSSTLIEELEKRFGDGVWISGELGDQANVRCPYCSKRGMTEDLSGHLGLNFRINKAHCVRCGWGHGSLSKWFANVGGVSARFTLGDLQRELKAVLDTTKKASYDARVGADLPREVMRIGKNSPPHFYGSLSDKGILWDEVRSNTLMYCPDGPYGQYVIFPFFEGECAVYWQARAASAELLADSKMKKRNPPSKDGLGKAAWLYGIDQAEPEGHFYLVEGTLDQISLQRWLKKELGDGHFAVSLQGTAISFPTVSCHPRNSQWGKLKRLNPKSVNPVFDADAWDKGVALSKVLRSTGLDSKPLKVIGKDPNEAIQRNYAGFTQGIRASMLGELAMLKQTLGLDL